ncbi:DUF3794 domain-containing protein [Neobacillus sp. PS3-34]|uniref:CsxC family protein n=1 Tax=Neobacillus sp. PS3-34 TaxID=3070678 RepID=UPI0027E20BC5|nr:DUF3794 domain-containing protein [Neobacillus sp. PS3-34]WML50093.1 DUF3794 domain-containing protein [Neobacillus sp. PS3-34]
MNKDQQQNCIDFNQSAGLETCTSTPVTPVTTPAGTRILRVPVTLAERTVTSTLSTNIHFPDPVLEIKDIKKRVKIVQCSLILDPVNPGQSPFDGAPGTLVLRGFVRKNIQYATPICDASGTCVSSNLKSLTVDVPFECMTVIPQGEFLTPPERPQLNSRAEFDFFRSQNLGMGFPEKDHLLSSDLSQFHQRNIAFYNQFPFCEILSHNILEWDEALDRQPLPGNAPFEEGTFTRIVEKMVLRFTIKVLQNQQVRVTAI